MRVSVCVCPCILVCNPFILTVAVLSGDRKEAAENKRLPLDGPFDSTEPAPHNWWVYICGGFFCCYVKPSVQTVCSRLMDGWTVSGGLSKGYFLTQLLDSEKNKWLLILTRHSRTALSGSSTSESQSSRLANPVGFHFSHIIRLIYTRDVRRMWLTGQ